MTESTAAPLDLLDRIRAAWAETLDVDVETVPLDSSFFEAGGNSLLLLLLLEQLNEMTSRDLVAADLFEHSTVRAQADLLATPEAARILTVRGADRRALLGRSRRDQPSDTGR